MKKIKLGLSATMLLAVVAVPTVSVLQAKAADGASYDSNGKVNFTPNSSTKPVHPVDPTDPTSPIDPTDPTDPNGPNPGTQGPLSIDFASSVDFGANEISTEDRTYSANPQGIKDSTKTIPNYVQVTDRRGSNAGWSLSVKQNYQFKNDKADTVNKVLDGAYVTFTKGTPATITANATAPTTYDVQLDPTGNSQSTIVDAAVRTGAGTWTNSFGKVEKVTENGVEATKNTGIKLFVPGKTPKDAVDYTTKFTWVLVDKPANK